MIVIYDRNDSAIIEPLHRIEFSLNKLTEKYFFQLTFLKLFWRFIEGWSGKKFGGLQPKGTLRAPLSGLHYKSFMIVIHDRNDSTIEEPLL